MSSQTSVSPIKVLIYNRDPADRWLIGNYLRQGTEREVVTQETDAMSEARIAADRGGLDLIIVDVDMPDQSGYWLEKILENQLAPVVALVGEDGGREMEEILGHGPVSCLPKNNLTREELNQAVEAAIRKWRALRRNEAHKDELERLANYDFLTGLLNRRAVLRRLEESMARSRRYGEELSVILFDLDHFKQVTETIGRTRSDAALQRIAGVLQRRLREADFVGRYGADEFIVVLPHTERESAKIAAERLRKMIEILELHDGEEKVCTLTVSAGLAEYTVGDDVGSMMYRAETCLCRAKDKGRNCVEP